MLTTRKDAARLGATPLPPALAGLHALHAATFVEEGDRFVSLLTGSLA